MYRQIDRLRVRVIKIQAVIIFTLLIALILALVLRPQAKTAPAATSSQLTFVEPIVLELDEPELTDLGEFRLTAYCPCVKCCGIWSAEHPDRIGTDYTQKTKSGTIPEQGRTVGVDPEVIPLGSVLIIDGQEYIAEDTGSAVNDKSIDIYFASHEDAVAFGAQNKTVYLKGE